MGRLAPRGALAITGLALAPCLAIAAAPARADVRAAYFYSYMDLAHVDSLVRRGFDRGIVHFIGDSLDAKQVKQLHDLAAHADSLGLDLAPQWSLQAPERLTALRTTRRYTWGKGHIEDEVGCPLDSAFWRSALIDRAEETLAAAPGIRRIAVDLEIYGAGVSHYSAGACRCPACLAEYTRRPVGALTAADAWRLSGLHAFEEARLGALLTRLLSEFAARHPGVEIGVFDLDLDSFVHRALARGLRRAQVPTADYCERSYSAVTGLTTARARLTSLGLGASPLIGGLWLKRFAPGDLRSAVRSIAAQADGYFVFTTYSLWLDPIQLSGPYTLAGRPSDYWRALAEVNLSP